MADNKRYYWLRLMDNFFKQPRIKKLRRMAGGDTYTIIYLKMQLLSLQNGGKLFFEGIEDDFFEELALNIDEEPEDVRMTVLYLNQQGLLLEGNNDDYTLPETVNSIGSETASTIRSRKSRTVKTLQCNTDATKCNGDIDIELEIDKEKHILSEADASDDVPNGKEDITDNIPYKEIIDYLNELAKTQYRHTSKSTKDKIKARYNDGFVINDFKKVISKKVTEWENTEMAKYLRPETLFGNKFEGYLNQSVRTNPKKQLPDWFHNQDIISTSDDEIDDEQLMEQLRKLGQKR